jgi:hypothetical protein
VGGTGNCEVNLDARPEHQHKFPATQPDGAYFETVETRGLTRALDQIDVIGIKSIAKLHEEAKPNNTTELSSRAALSPHVMNIIDHTSDSFTPVGPKAQADESIEIVEDTPEERLESSSSKQRQYKDVVQARVLEFEELSPRMADFAIHGAVPSTPGKDTTPVFGAVPSFSKPPRTPVSKLPSSCVLTKKTPQERKTLAPGFVYAHPAGDVSLDPRILLNRILGSNASSPVKVRSSLSTKEGWQVNKNEAVNSIQKPRKLKRLRRPCGQLPLSQAEENLVEVRSPLQILSSGNGGEDWQINHSEPPAPTQRPRKLKRLRRAREKTLDSNGDETVMDQGSPLDAQNRSRAQRSKSKIGMEFGILPSFCVR